MKTKIFLSLLVILTSLIIAQSDTGNKEKLTGIWEGKLSIQGMALRIVFNLEVKNDSLTGTLDSPDQGAKGIPLGEITLLDDSLTIQVPAVGGFFKGQINSDEQGISGQWSQGGMSLPLELKKTDKVEEVKRPQTPVEPFPYKIEEVKFRNEKADINLAGTLTIPNGSGDFPAVIMVTGSGAQDRDETLLNHKPFWVIADHLSRNGIAVLRYDDRGTAESEGIYSGATTMDFTDDANAAANFLITRTEFKNSRIGIIGHSEGGLVAPLVSVGNEDIDFIILLAGPSLPGDEILLRQSRLIAKAEGADDPTIKRDLDFSNSIYDILKSDTDSATASRQISESFRKYYESLSEEEKQKAGAIDIILEQNLKVINSAWFRHFVKYDPKPVLEKVTVPVLALYGEMDLQVPSKENITAMKEALENNGNKNTKVMEMAGLNHLFQKASTGSPTEYGSIEETFSADAIKIIIDWIHDLD